MQGHSAATAHLMVIPFAILEWFIVASVGLYWNRLFRPFWRVASWLLMCTCIIGFLLIQIDCYSRVSDIDLGQDIFFSIEILTEKLVSLNLLFSILRRQGVQLRVGGACVFCKPTNCSNAAGE
jgi:hypothetical protein